MTSLSANRIFSSTACQHFVINEVDKKKIRKSGKKFKLINYFFMSDVCVNSQERERETKSNTSRLKQLARISIRMLFSYEIHFDLAVIVHSFFFLFLFWMNEISFCVYNFFFFSSYRIWLCRRSVIAKCLPCKTFLVFFYVVQIKK